MSAACRLWYINSLGSASSPSSALSSPVHLHIAFDLLIPCRMYDQALPFIFHAQRPRVCHGVPSTVYVADD
ncbi:hypothetical protein F4604DRAFT_1930686 [Suillus subluteus]|nr:hypothetical protein F4604DRAFT_1930686 [Suillus subluteus]